MKKRFNANQRKEKGERISARETIDIPPEQQPPLFSLRHMNKDYSISQCTKDEKAALADTLHQLSQLTWTQYSALVFVFQAAHSTGTPGVKEGDRTSS